MKDRRKTTRAVFVKHLVNEVIGWALVAIAVMLAILSLGT